MQGVIAYGAYLPRYRLDRGAVTEVLSVPGARGTRAVAGYDEDTTTLGVAAAREAMVGAPATAAPRKLLFATSRPAYLGKSNAGAVHAALDLDPSCIALDVGGAVRSGLGGLLLAIQGGASTLAVAADIRTGRPGSADEVEGGDGAAAFLCGSSADHPLCAELISTASTSVEFLDRWRLPGEHVDHVWEDRAAEDIYRTAAVSAFADALKLADLSPADIGHVVVTGTHNRAARAVRRALGVDPAVQRTDRVEEIGQCGAAHAGLLLCDALDAAAPAEVIALVSLADGADVLLLRATELARRRPTPATISLRYLDFLCWRGMLEREPPRRPDPEPPAAPPASRRARWKFGLIGSRCLECNSRQLPPSRVCLRCSTTDRMAPDAISSLRGTIRTFTVDRLAATPAPPLVAAVVDVDGGGRLRVELTEAEPDAVRAGDRVEFTFRRIVTARGVHNYFWKARLSPDGEV